MIVGIVIVVVVALLAIGIHMDEKRKKEARALAEQKRRNGIIARLQNLSQQITKDPDSQSFLKALDDIILPQQNIVSSVEIRVATVAIRISPQRGSKWSTTEDRVIEVSMLSYHVAYTGDDDQIAFAYTLINRYPFLCYKFISSVPGEGKVTTRELEKVYFEAFDDSGHDVPRVLYNTDCV